MKKCENRKYLQSDAYSNNYDMTYQIKRISTYTLSFQKSSLLYIFLYFYYTQDVSKIARTVVRWALTSLLGSWDFDVLSEYSEHFSEKK